MSAAPQIKRVKGEKNRTYFQKTQTEEEEKSQMTPPWVGWVVSFQLWCCGLSLKKKFGVRQSPFPHTKLWAPNSPLFTIKNIFILSFILFCYFNLNRDVGNESCRILSQKSCLVLSSSSSKVHNSKRASLLFFAGKEGKEGVAGPNGFPPSTVFSFLGDGIPLSCPQDLASNGKRRTRVGKKELLRTN